MELGVFLSLVLVLFVLFVALVCDFLKGNNEQLRERNIELRVREDERKRLGLTQPLAWLKGLVALARSPGLADRIPSETTAAEKTPEVRTPAAAAAHAPPDLEKLSQPPPSGPEPKPGPRTDEGTASSVKPAAKTGGTPPPPWVGSDSGSSWATAEEVELLAERSARIRAKQEPAAGDPEIPITSPEESRPWRAEPAAQPPPVLLDPVIEEARAPEAPVPVDVVKIAAPVDVEEVDEPAPPLHQDWPESYGETGTSDTQAPERIEQPAGADAAARPDLRRELERLALAQEEAIAPLPELAPAPEEEITPVEASLNAEASDEDSRVATKEVSPGAEPLSIPGGVHEPEVLSRLMESRSPFTGVIVAIGINDYEKLQATMQADSRDTAPAPDTASSGLTRLVKSMLRPGDFACRFREDEYILIYPGEVGAPAQRRLFQVSEKLWDFQLRSIGDLSVMFSWGGTEVSGESIADGVAAARERLLQTRRSRRPSPVDITITRKRVVNA